MTHDFFCNEFPKSLMLDSLSKIIIISLLMITPCNVYAIRADYSLGVELEYSDNINLLPTDGDSDLRQIGLFGVVIEESAPKFNTNNTLLAEYQKYKNNTFSSEGYYYLNSDTVFTIKPQRISWNLTDYYSVIEINDDSAASPDNLMQANAFSTGPVVTLNINNYNTLLFNALYTRYYYESNDLDSVHSTFNISWSNSIARQTDFLISSSYTNVNYIDAAGLDYTRSDIYAEFNSRVSRVEYELDIGMSYFDTEVGDNFDGGLLRFTIFNQFRSSSYFQLSALSQISDSSIDLIGTEEFSSELNRTPAQLTGLLFRDKQLDFAYFLALSSFTVGLELQYRDENYQVNVNDRRTTGAAIELDRTISSVSSLYFRAQYVNRVYDQVEQETREILNSIGFNYQLSRNIHITGELNINELKAEFPLLGYHENSIMLYMHYGIDPGSYR